LNLESCANGERGREQQQQQEEGRTAVEKDEEKNNKRRRKQKRKGKLGSRRTGDFRGISEDLLVA
jgi:hypothetical protein